MGLDMYLTGKKYVKDWNHNYEDGKIPAATPAKKCQKAVGAKFPVKYVELELAYWRKANAIHEWFVNNVQGGVDECQQAYVTKEKLEELLAVCNEVLKDTSRAASVLPTQGGFFFGSTTYDEWYYQDIEETKKVLEKLLKCDDLDDMEIYYQSSW